MTNEVGFRAKVVCEATLRLDGDEVGDWVDLTQSWDAVQDAADEIVRKHTRYADTEDHFFFGDYTVVEYSEGFDPLPIDENISLDLAHEIAQVAMNEPVVLDVMTDELDNETGLNGVTPISYDMLERARKYVESYFLGDYDDYNDYLRRQAEYMSETEIDADGWWPDDFNWAEYGFNPDTCLDNCHVINRGRRFLVFAT